MSPDVAANELITVAHLFVHVRGKEVRMTLKVLEHGVHVPHDEFASFGRQIHPAQNFWQLDKQPKEVDWAVDERWHWSINRVTGNVISVNGIWNELPHFDGSHHLVRGRGRRTETKLSRKFC